MRLASLSIENIRSIASGRLVVDEAVRKRLKYPNVHVLLGNNGSGKTTVLRSIALAVLGPALGDTGFRPDGYVRTAPKDPPSRGRIQVSLRLDPQDRTEGLPASLEALDLAIAIERLGDGERITWERIGKMPAGLEATFYTSSSSAFFMAGYGATRRVDPTDRVDISAREKARSPRYQRVASLFEDHVALLPLASWLPQFKRSNPGRYKQVVELMNSLLPPSCRLLAEPLSGPSGLDYEFEFDGVRVPFRALSDGYRAYVGWIGDMLFHVCMGSPSGAKLRANRGIVLIDEVDLHLPASGLAAFRHADPLDPVAGHAVHRDDAQPPGRRLAGGGQYLHGAARGPGQRHGTAAGAGAWPEFGADPAESVLRPGSTRAPEVAQRMRDLATRAAGPAGRAAAVQYMKMMLPSGAAAAAESKPKPGRKAPARRPGASPRDR